MIDIQRDVRRDLSLKGRFAVLKPQRRYGGLQRLPLNQQQKRIHECVALYQSSIKIHAKRAHEATLGVGTGFWMLTHVLEWDYKSGAKPESILRSLDMTQRY